jgi:SAM-dependent methyltransferase
MSQSNNPQNPRVRGDLQKPLEYRSANLSKWEYSGALYQKHLELYLDAMFALLQETGAHTVLDAGCGEGVVYRAMRKRGFIGEWTGIDLSSDAIDYAKRESPEATWLVGSVFDMPFPSKNFDLVFSSQVLEHLPAPEKALREFARCARQWLLISVPYEPLFRWLTWISVRFRLGGDPGHVNHWRPREFRRFVSQSSELKSWQRTTVYQIGLVKLSE